MVLAAEYCSEPPPNEIVPEELSAPEAPTFSSPPLRATPPVNVLFPVSVSTPVPVLMRKTVAEALEITPENVLLLFRAPTVSVPVPGFPAPVMLPLPVSAPNCRFSPSPTNRP